MKRDYPSIVAELVMALRGDRSAAETSRLMGFSFNQVRRWEAGEKQLRWDEFCQLCETLGIPLAKALRANFMFTWPDPRSLPRFLRSNCYPYLTLEEISERLHRHPSAMRRYLEGEVFPDLELILAFIDLDNQRLPRFLLDFLPENYRSDFRKQLEAEVRHLDEASLRPILAALKHWLNTGTYIDLPAHDDSFLAQKLNCSVDEVRAHLCELVRIESAKIDENGKYVPLHLDSLVGTSNRKLYRETQQYWYGRVAHFYEHHYPAQKGPVGRVVTSRVVSMSPQQAEQINEIIARVYSEITGILAEGDGRPQDDVRLVLMGSFSLQDLL